MAKTKVKLLLNLGWQDANGLGLGDLTAEELAEGEVIDVDDVQATKLVNGMKCAAVYDPAKEKKTATGKAVKATAQNKFGQLRVDEGLVEEETETDEGEGEASESPVAGDAASVAIDAISRMHSVEKLQSITETDPRKTVVDAANKRLEEIKA